METTTKGSVLLPLSKFGRPEQEKWTMSFYFRLPPPSSALILSNSLSLMEF